MAHVETAILSSSQMGLMTHIRCWTSVMRGASRRLLPPWAAESAPVPTEERLPSRVPAGPFLTGVTSRHLPHQGLLLLHVQNTHPAGDRCHRQCSQMSSVSQTKPHFSWQIKTANKISFLICMRSCRTHQMRIKGGKVRSPQANPGDLCYGYASLIAESLSLLLWKGHWIWNWKNRRKSWLCYILSASP